MWTYGLQLWSNAKKSNLNKIQIFQNIALRKLLNAPPYVSNYTIHSDLKIPLVYDEAKSYYNVSICAYYHIPIRLLEIFLLQQFPVTRHEG